MFESVIIFLKLLHALKDVEANDLTELYKHTILTVIAALPFSRFYDCWNLFFLKIYNQQVSEVGILFKIN